MLLDRVMDNLSTPSLHVTWLDRSPLTNGLNFSLGAMARRSCIELEAPMSEHDNLRIIHEAFEAWNAHDVDRYAALLGEGYVEETHTMPRSVRGREAARAVMQEYLRVLPDLHFDLDIMVSSGDQVFTRWRVTGTYGGELTSVPPVDRRVEDCGCTLSKLERGKIIHVWHYWETDHIPRHVAPH